MDENLTNQTEEIDENAHTYHTVDAKPVHLKPNYKFFTKNIVFRAFSRFCVIFLGMIIMPWNILINGFRIKGKKNYRKIRKQGAIIISNHINPGDAFFSGWVMMWRRIWVTTLQSNLGLPFGFGKFLVLMGGVPIPEEKALLVKFRNEFIDAVENKNKKVIIYPEAALIPFCDHIRPFKKGAFRFATMANAPILPIVYTYRKPKGLIRLWRRKPCLTINFLEPYTVKGETHAEKINSSMEDLHQIMSDFFNENTTYKYVKKEKKKNKKEPK